MEHRQIEELLHEYRDGELPAAERAEIAGHLAACVSCAARLQAWDRLAAAFFKPTPVPSSEVFVAKVMRRLHARPSRGPLRWLVPSLAAAALLIALALSRGPETVYAETILLNGDEDLSDVLDKEPENEDVLSLALEAP